MASPVPTPSGSSNPSPRWPRSGPEPGSAFTGLGRGGRGRGRGGRGGGGRPNTTSRDNKSPGETRPPKGAPQEKPGPAQPSKISAPSAGPSAAEKPSIPNPTKPKPSSRKSSHNVPSVIVASPGADVSSAPSPKSQNRRRRSQTIKGSGLQKINPPAADDNLLRPIRPRLPTVPHTAPIKDTPPHLSNNNFDMRNNIDALVERVRAVAMAENRPSTPGSHIDWAGDDDDSLPDLDDWGVSTSSQSTHPAEMISPIIVDGLRPLPEPTSKPLTPPISRLEVVSPSPPISGNKPAEIDSSPSSTPFTPTGLFNEESKRSNFQSTLVPDPSPNKAAPPNINAKGADTIKTSLHPSLPPKPVTSAQNARARPVGNHTRGPTTPAPSAKETSVVPKPIPENLTPVNAGPKAESNEPFPKEVVDETPTTTTTTNNIPDIKEDVINEGVAKSNHASSSTEDFLIGRENSDLYASIHAPQALVDSLSAPAGLSSYTETSLGSRISPYGHTRAHTVGRPPSFPRSPPGEYVPRFSRSGQNTPRGGGGGGYQENSHFRTHSTPPAGAGLNNYRTPHSRPVITGDAISKLARTIGTSNGSPLNRPIITGETISRLARSIDGSKQSTIAASNE